MAFGRHPRFQGRSENFPHSWTSGRVSDSGNISRWSRNLHSVFEQEYFCTPLRLLLDTGNSVTDIHVFSLFWEQKIACLCVCFGVLGNQAGFVTALCRFDSLWHFTSKNGISLRPCCKLRWDDNVFLNYLRSVRDSSEVMCVKCTQSCWQARLRLFGI